MRSDHDVTTTLAVATWRKSSYSGGSGGDCVEMSDGLLPGAVPVRDSRRRSGPVIVVPAGAWTAFVGAVRDGAIGRRAGEVTS